jgi:hypothetical protein
MPEWLTASWISAIGTATATLLLALGYVVPAFYRWARRPVLAIEYANRAPWIRVSHFGDNPPTFGLFFRVYVRNTGRTTARLVRGRLEAFHDRAGRADSDVDPCDLHWVGTSFEALPEGITLLAKQGEYLDLIFVPCLHSADLPQAHTFQFYPQDATPRGTKTCEHFFGQRLVIRVAAENAGATGIEFELPDGGVLGDGATNGLRYRLLHSNGEIPGDWQQ